MGDIIRQVVIICSKCRRVCKKFRYPNTRFKGVLTDCCGVHGLLINKLPEVEPGEPYPRVQESYTRL